MKEFGGGEVLDPETIKSLLLQVTEFFLDRGTIGTDFASFKTSILMLEFLKISYSSQGLHHIRIGYKLQEVVARYQSEGWSRVYFALAGTDTHILVDMWSELFGEPTQLEPVEFDTLPVKHQCMQGMKEETKNTELAGEKDLSKEIIILYPTGPKVSAEFSIEKDFLPKSKSIKEEDSKGVVVAKTYYLCPMCSYQIQNKTLVITHGRRDHLHVKIGCKFCNYTLDASKSMEKHFTAIHKSEFTTEGLTEQEAKDVMDTISSYELTEMEEN